MFLSILFLIFFMFFFIIQSIAFITLYERHLLSLSQTRLGPNKVSLMGLLQAIMDGIKLLMKEQMIPKFSSKSMFLSIPMVSFFMMFSYWMLAPYFYNFSSFEMSLIIFLCFLGSFIYVIFLSGTFSKSKYGMLGSIRSSSQTISYEISFTFLFLCFLFKMKSYMLEIMFLFDLFLIIFIFIISIICELNRAPFDLAEGESELVSGFNTEFSSISFVLLFLSEYGILIFFSVILSFLFTKFSMLMVFMSFSFLIFIRSCYPRLRYDFNMYLFWFIILPTSMMCFTYFLFI